MELAARDFRDFFVSCLKYLFFQHTQTIPLVYEYLTNTFYTTGVVNVDGTINYGNMNTFMIDNLKKFIAVRVDFIFSGVNIFSLTNDEDNRLQFANCVNSFVQKIDDLQTIQDEIISAAQYFGGVFSADNFYAVEFRMYGWMYDGDMSGIQPPPLPKGIGHDIIGQTLIVY